MEHTDLNGMPKKSAVTGNDEVYDEAYDELDKTIELDVVCGEPISRSEAHDLGLRGFSDDAVEGLGGTGMVTKNAVPQDVDALPPELEQVKVLLKKNRIDSACIMAQDAVKKNPCLYAGKLILARCLMLKSEYREALEEIQKIPETAMDAESYYYKAEILATLGRRDAASEAAGKAMASEPGSETRVLIKSLLERLHAGTAEAAPPSVRWSIRRNSTVGNAAPPKTNRANRTVMRLVLVVLAIALLALAVVAFSVFAPDTYTKFRERLPAAWIFLPDAVPTQSGTSLLIRPYDQGNHSRASHPVTKEVRVLPQNIL